MNQPEGYVLVQIKQLAQWREWANNVAAWSKQADRSSEVARLKASISSAMISATLPPASAAGDSGAGERAILEQIALEEQAMNQADADGRHLNAQGHQQAIEAYKFCLAAITSKPQEATPPAQTVPEDIIRYAKSMQKEGYRGPLAWASAIIDWVAGQGAARTRGDEVGKSS